jgi:hypothetical protein
MQIVWGINMAVAQSDQFLILPVRKKSFFEALYRWAKYYRHLYRQKSQVQRW